jgi:RNA polymerase sigma factor for flagellar operon FliA
LDPEIAALVESLIPQAEAIACRKYNTAPHALDREELISIAYEGLLDAGRKWAGYCERNGYDPARAVDGYFAAYASRRMKGAILDHMRALDWVPRSVRNKAKRIDAAHAQGAKSTAELAHGAGMTLAELHATQAALARRPVSLDDGERDVAEQQGVEGSTTVAQILAAVRHAGHSLPREQRVVLALRYWEEMGIPQIALALGMSRGAVTAAHDAGVRAVREAMAAVAS